MKKKKDKKSAEIQKYTSKEKKLNETNKVLHIINSINIIFL